MFPYQSVPVNILHFNLFLWRFAMRKATMFLALAALVTASQARAALVDLGAGSFTPAATAITFDEVALGTVNPVYNFTGLPGLGNETVSFGGYFVGQGAVEPNPPVVTLNPSTPTVGQPLALDPNAPVTVTVDDSAPGATSPVLSGTPTFNGPISVLFSTPVAGVGLKGGYFDALNSTSIEAFDSTGHVLGSITNSVLGFQFYGLADSTGANDIAGISFFITGNEPAGFEIDDLTFGAAAQINNPAVPLPPAVWSGLALLGCLGAMKFGRRVRTA
jgi:hypothetical protein